MKNKRLTVVLLFVLCVVCAALAACFYIVPDPDNDDGDDVTTHVHDFGDNYFVFVQCSVCDVVGRKASTDSAKVNFVYDFDETKKSEIDRDYLALTENLGVVTEEEYETMFEIYDDDLNYVMEQYQYAYVFYSAYFDSASTENYNTISDYYNECIANYYGLFDDIYNSSYKDQFFAGWTDDEITQILALADSYGNSEYADLQNQISALIIEYNDMLDSATSKQLTSKYEELVELNNQLADLAGYDNYCDYAYAVTYERDYTPAEVSSMRNYVKDYIGDVFDSVYEKYIQAYNGVSNGFMFGSKSNAYNFYTALCGASVFGETSSSQTAVNLVGDYFGQMTSDSSATPIDFYTQANEIFKNGNYYLGEQSGAFTYWIPNQNTSILYFSDETDDEGNYYYQNAFTFVHEFGHYYNGVYNGGLSLSLDLDETQSQGNEMLFLAWLSQNTLGNVSKGLDLVYYEQLTDILSTIIISTAVDEFEQAVYTDSYNGKSVKNTYNDYTKLFSEILEDYGYYASMLNTSYWSYVVFDSSCYYISYAMSALPCVELHVLAMSDFNSAKASYFRLFTFSDDSSLVETDGDDKTVVATYEQILNYCGLQGPFSEGLYTTISNYLK